MKYNKNKDLRLIYILACGKTDKSLYKAALEDYAASFPASPNIYLLMLDAYYLNQQYDKGIEAVNKLDSLVKGDPFLDYYRANFNSAAGNTAGAKVLFKDVLTYDSNITSTIISLVTLYMYDNQVKEAKAALEDYMKSTGFQQEYIDKVYQEFPVLKK